MIQHRKKSIFFKQVEIWHRVRKCLLLQSRHCGHSAPGLHAQAASDRLGLCMGIKGQILSSSHPVAGL